MTAPAPVGRIEAPSVAAGPTLIGARFTVREGGRDDAKRPAPGRP